MLEDAYACARKIIEQKNDRINAMADLLLEKETIYAEDIERILGPRRSRPKPCCWNETGGGCRRQGRGR